MWNEPYLESCCRAALHRLVLTAADGRPDWLKDGGLKDGPCLERLAGMGFADHRPDGRYGVTESGAARHRSEILRRGTAA